MSLNIEKTSVVGRSGCLPSVFEVELEQSWSIYRWRVTICWPLGLGLIARGNFSESWAEMKGMGDKILVWWTENAFSKCLLISNVSPFATWVHLWLFVTQGNQTIIWFSISQRKCMQYHALQTFWDLVINHNLLWFEANYSRVFQPHFLYSLIKFYIIRGFKSLSKELLTRQADQKDRASDLKQSWDQTSNLWLVEFKRYVENVWIKQEMVCGDKRKYPRIKVYTVAN